MVLIAHRGYVNGKNSLLENNPLQIKRLLKMNINVEIDVIYEDGKVFLGHDDLKYQVDIDFLKQEGLWCHAKNMEALRMMLDNNIHCFWHQEDDYTITSRGYVWAYPGKETDGKKTVLLFPERHPDIDYTKYDFVCTDYIDKYKGEHNGKQ